MLTRSKKLKSSDKEQSKSNQSSEVQTTGFSPKQVMTRRVATEKVPVKKVTAKEITSEEVTPCKATWLWNIGTHHTLALVLRVVMVAVGVYQDSSSGVPYTDVDYHVVTDGAGWVWAGGSPFQRHTYRYTPLLAWAMLPNVIFNLHIGKLLFCLLDHVASHIIYKMVLRCNVGKNNAVKSSLLWLYNPMVIGISTRGSAESMIVTMVLIVLYYREESSVISGMWLGAAIHVKLYPIIYCLPIYMSLENSSSRNLFQKLAITNKRFLFVVSVVLSFSLLTGLSYSLYGKEYIREGFLYHLNRVDTRHNFSTWFYFLYLSVDYDIPFLGLVTFLPQFSAVVLCGFVFNRNSHELLIGMFCQTVVFVAFNKVVTSQYFLWYLVFIPLIHDKLGMSAYKKFFLLSVWFVTQALWLLPAYLFEFKGIDTFLYMWLGSIAFFSCNVYVLTSVISSYAVDMKLKLC